MQSHQAVWELSTSIFAIMIFNIVRKSEIEIFSGIQAQYLHLQCPYFLQSFLLSLQFPISPILNKTCLLLTLYLKLFLSLSFFSVNIIKWVISTYNLHLLTSHPCLNPQQSGSAPTVPLKRFSLKITNNLPIAVSNCLSVTSDLIDYSLFLEVFPSFLRYCSFLVITGNFCYITLKFWDLNRSGLQWRFSIMVTFLV